MIRRQNLLLIALGTLLMVVYAGLLKLSFSFEPASIPKDRPIVMMLSAFGVAFVCYFAACFVALRTERKNEKELGRKRQRIGSGMMIVLIFGVAFRAIMIFSTPIQEVDIYRYIWDGKVSNAGVDPYLYPPMSVVAALNEPQLPQAAFPDSLEGLQSIDEIDALKTLVRKEKGTKEVLELVHYPQFTTPYPPVSQFVFATAIKLAKPDASKKSLVFATKLAIALFDLGTALLVAGILYQVGLPTTWSIAYCWCPLLIKEFSNSGHLDSIAVFFCTAGVFATVAGINAARNELPENNVLGRRYFPTLWFLIASVSLAFAVGSKLYPVVVFPLWALACFRAVGFRSFLSMALFVLVSFTVTWPMLKHTGPVKNNYQEWMPVAFRSTFPAAETFDRDGHDRNGGIEAFLESWEMNDLLFMCVVENLKLEHETHLTPWFVIVDNRTRRSVRAWFENFATKPLTAFVVARAITVGIFGLLVLWTLYGFLKLPTSKQFLNLTFLTIAWFWFLSPTQNPWYWAWAMPFVIFANSRVWMLVAATTMLYYYRFYVSYHGPTRSEYVFFDHYFPWFEFTPILVFLVCEWCFRRFKIQ